MAEYNTEADNAAVKNDIKNLISHTYYLNEYLDEAYEILKSVEHAVKGAGWDWEVLEAKMNEQAEAYSTIRLATGIYLDVLDDEEE